LLDRGLAHQAGAFEDLREALRCYERAIELEPSLAKAHYQLVATYAALGQAHDAVVFYELRLSQAPNAIGGHYSRAFLLERLGRSAEAAAEWGAIVAWCRERGYDE